MAPRDACSPTTFDSISPELAFVLEDQIELGARVHGPEEDFLLAKIQMLDRLFQRNSFPRGAQLRMPQVSLCQALEGIVK